VEIRERAVRLVLEHQGEYPSQWAAISSIATKCGMTPETLRKWVRRADTRAPRRCAGPRQRRQRDHRLDSHSWSALGDNSDDGGHTNRGLL